MYEDTAYGVAQSRGLRRATKDANIEVVMDEPYPYASAAHDHSGNRRGTGYIIPDFEKGLGEFADAVLSISPTSYDLAPALTAPFRKRFGYFMVHEAIEQALALDVLVQAIERARSAKPKAVTEALHGVRFDGGWTKAMPGGAVQFDQTGLNALATTNHGPMAQTLSKMRLHRLSPHPSPTRHVRTLTRPTHRNRSKDDHDRGPSGLGAVRIHLISFVGPGGLFHFIISALERERGLPSRSNLALLPGLSGKIL
jgi:hypothetical protein